MMRQESIVDAERPPTPWDAGGGGNAIKSKKSAGIGNTGVEKGRKKHAEIIKILKNWCRNRHEIIKNSRLRRGCVLETLWGGLGGEN